MKWHIPDSLYHALPYLYVMAGVAVPLMIDHPLAKLSALALAGVGLWVFSARLTNRVIKRHLGHYRRCEMAHTCPNRVG